MADLLLKDIRPDIPFKDSKGHVYIRHIMTLGNAFSEDMIDLRKFVNDPNRIIHLDYLRIDLIPQTAHNNKTQAHISHNNLTAMATDSTVITHHHVYGVASGTGGIRHGGNPTLILDFSKFNGIRYPYWKLYLAGRTNAASMTAQAIFHIILHKEMRDDMERAADNINVRNVRND